MQKPQQYRVQDIDKAYIALCNSKPNSNPALFAEQLNQIGRILVWGDKYNSDIVDYMCEVKMLDFLIDVFGKSKEKDIINSVIGFINMLFTNISKQETVNYLLSHPCVLSIQMTKFGNMGNQIAEYYINFLKSLSRKANQNTLHLFFNKKYPNFPLLMQTIRFYNHPQSLVRTTCKNIILTLSKIKNAKTNQFFIGFPFCYYYLHECNFIKEYWQIIDEIIDSNADKHYELQNLDTILQDHQEVLFYIDDFLKVHQKPVVVNLLDLQEDEPTIVDKFVDAFINQCLSPLLLSLSSDRKDHFGIKTSLLMLSILFKTISNQLLLQTILMYTFGRYYTKQMTDKLFLPIQRVLSYDKKWKFKGFWDSHQDKIIQYCSVTYHGEKSIKSDISKNKQESQSSVDTSFSKKFVQIDTLSVFGVSNNFYERQIQKIQQIFGISIIQKHKKSQNIPGSRVIKKMKESIKSQKQIDLSSFEVNPIADAIFSYLSSKDDTLMILTLSVILNVLKLKNISNEILMYCQLSIKPKTRDFQSIIKIERLILSCVKLFQIDPPCYRICTYKEAQQIIYLLTPLYNDPNSQFPIDILNSLKKALKSAIQRINPYLYGGKQWQKSVQLYFTACKENQKKRIKSLKHYGFIPPQENVEEDQKLSIIKLLYQEFPRTFHQQIVRDFWIYIILRDIYVELNQSFAFTKEDLSFQDKSSEQKQQKYEQGNQYSALNEQIIKGQIRQINEQRYNPCEFVFFQNFFIIGQGKKVSNKCRYEDAMIISDKSDPRKLMMKMQYSRALSVGFSDSKIAVSVKKHFQDMKSTMFKYNLSKLIKQIEKMLTCCS